MHKLEELPAWERLFKRIVWKQMGDIKGKRILDFGSGEGITANYFAKTNDVIAIEPCEDMIKNAWKDNQYEQIIGDVSSLSKFEDEYFDYIICHNVLEYIDDKMEVIKELSRLLKKNGTISIVKHNRYGRVMQMAVLLDDIYKANSILDGNNSHASKFGEIMYYNDEDIIKYDKTLKIKDTYGIRTFFDLQQNQEKHADEAWQLNMMSLEMKVSQIDEFMKIAFFHHILLTK